MQQFSLSLHSCKTEAVENTTELPSEMYTSCCLKRCQCCYAVVRKDFTKQSHSDALRFGPNSLPGVVDIDELCTKSTHRKETFANRFSRFWNANLQLSHSRQNEKFVDFTHHFLVQIRKFISKLRKASSEELNYIEKLKNYSFNYATSTKHENGFVSRNLRYNTNDSNFFDSEDEFQEENETSFIRPVKLGKVYAELKMHFKAWSDIMEKWQASRYYFLDVCKTTISAKCRLCSCKFGCLLKISNWLLWYLINWMLYSKKK